MKKLLIMLSFLVGILGVSAAEITLPQVQLEYGNSLEYTSGALGNVSNTLYVQPGDSGSGVKTAFYIINKYTISEFSNGNTEITNFHTPTAIDVSDLPDGKHSLLMFVQDKTERGTMGVYSFTKEQFPGPDGCLSIYNRVTGNVEWTCEGDFPTKIVMDLCSESGVSSLTLNINGLEQEKSCVLPPEVTLACVSINDTETEWEENFQTDGGVRCLGIVEPPRPIVTGDAPVQPGRSYKIQMTQVTQDGNTSATVAAELEEDVNINEGEIRKEVGVYTENGSYDITVRGSVDENETVFDEKTISFTIDTSNPVMSARWGSGNWKGDSSLFYLDVKDQEFIENTGDTTVNEETGIKSVQLSIFKQDTTKTTPHFRNKIMTKSFPESADEIFTTGIEEKDINIGDLLKTEGSNISDGYYKISATATDLVGHVTVTDFYLGFDINSPKVALDVPMDDQGADVDTWWTQELPSATFDTENTTETHIIVGDTAGLHRGGINVTNNNEFLLGITDEWQTDTDTYRSWRGGTVTYNTYNLQSIEYCIFDNTEENEALLNSELLSSGGCTLQTANKIYTNAAFIPKDSKQLYRLMADESGAKGFYVKVVDNAGNTTEKRFFMNIDMKPIITVDRADWVNFAAGESLTVSVRELDEDSKYYRMDRQRQRTIKTNAHSPYIYYMYLKSKNEDTLAMIPFPYFGSDRSKRYKDSQVTIDKEAYAVASENIIHEAFYWKAGANPDRYNIVRSESEDTSTKIKTMDTFVEYWTARNCRRTGRWWKKRTVCDYFKQKVLIHTITLKPLDNIASGKYELIASYCNSRNYKTDCLTLQHRLANPDAAVKATLASTSASTMVFIDNDDSVHTSDTDKYKLNFHIASQNGELIGSPPENIKYCTQEDLENIATTNEGKTAVLNCIPSVSVAYKDESLPVGKTPTELLSIEKQQMVPPRSQATSPAYVSETIEDEISEFVFANKKGGLISQENILSNTLSNEEKKDKKKNLVIDSLISAHADDILKEVSLNNLAYKPSGLLKYGALDALVNKDEGAGRIDQIKQDAQKILGMTDDEASQSLPVTIQLSKGSPLYSLTGGELVAVVIPEDGNFQTKTAFSTKSEDFTPGLSLAEKKIKKERMIAELEEELEEVGISIGDLASLEDKGNLEAELKKTASYQPLIDIAQGQFDNTVQDPELLNLYGLLEDIRRSYVENTMDDLVLSYATEDVSADNLSDESVIPPFFHEYIKAEFYAADQVEAVEEYLIAIESYFAEEAIEGGVLKLVWGKRVDAEKYKYPENIDKLSVVLSMGRDAAGKEIITINKQSTPIAYQFANKTKGFDWAYSVDGSVQLDYNTDTSRLFIYTCQAEILDDTCIVQGTIEYKLERDFILSQISASGMNISQNSNALYKEKNNALLSDLVHKWDSIVTIQERTSGRLNKTTFDVIIKNDQLEGIYFVVNETKRRFDYISNIDALDVESLEQNVSQLQKISVYKNIDRAGIDEPLYTRTYTIDQVSGKLRSTSSTKQ